MKIKVNVKNAGSRRPCVEETEFDLGEKFSPNSTVAEFLDEITRICVSEYNERRKNGEILKVLSERQIEEKSRSGKIGFGVNYGEKDSSLENAIANTRQCYLDGLFALFIDGKEIAGLDSSAPLENRIEIREGSIVTFIRLTMLAGRMW
ncbi:MAG: hypothetical protein IKO57_05790 [Treponema sp.]|nr:hypothetical protein [Treponema sp.]